MFQHPFSFDGRIRRTEYGLSYLVYMVGAFVLSFLAEASGGSEVVRLIGLIPLLWFLVAQGSKRCHDLGNSGWYQLIPFYGLWMLFQDSDDGPNEYGPNPKGIGNESFEDQIDQIGME